MRVVLLAGAMAIIGCAAPDDVSPRRPLVARAVGFVGNGDIGIQLGNPTVVMTSDQVGPGPEEKLVPMSGVWDGPSDLGSWNVETGVWTQKVGAQTVETVIAPVSSVLAQRWSPPRELPSGRLPDGLRQRTVRGERFLWPASAPERSLTFSQAVEESRAFLSFGPRFVIERAPDDALWLNTQTARLRLALAGRRPNLGPFGLSNTQYNGHVFWDADLWVLPAIAFLDPELAKRIPEYRLSRLPVAEAEFDRWRGGKGEPRGAKYPWESGVSGRETMAGPSSQSSHITGSVAFGLKFAEALGLAPPNGVLDRAQVWTMARSTPGGRGREIRQTMTADEQLQDNDLYTNAVSQWVLNGGTWRPGRERMAFPRDERSFLTFDGDPGEGYKQASAVLTVFPLQMPDAEAQAMTMLERFAPATFPHGPSMTGTIHATIRARFGDADVAYREWRSDIDRHTTAAGLFSEKERVPETHFLTGSAGALNTVLYGFLGLRVDEQALPGAAVVLPLRAGRILSIKPNVPSAWGTIRLEGITILGRRATLTATGRTARLEFDAEGG